MKNEILNDSIVAMIVAEKYGCRLDELTISDQTGGLFNHVVKVRDTKSNREWYCKQYLDKSVSTVFSPPEIPKEIRCNLAYKVQEYAFRETQGIGLRSLGVANVEMVLEHNMLIVDGVESPSELINSISNNIKVTQEMEDLGVLLAKLHVSTKGKRKYLCDEMYLNTEFRDFKLKLQYSNMADMEIFSEKEKASICRMLERYIDDKICMLHGDINSRNIIISKSNSLGGIIDFEQSHIGSPIYDIAYILCEFLIAGVYFSSDIGAKAFAAFRSGYEMIDNEYIEHHMDDIMSHLSLQSLYRVYGPSRRAWTFYVNDEQRKEMLIVEMKKALISETYRSEYAEKLFGIYGRR